MRYKRLIAALLTAVFLLGFRVPVIADDGRYRVFHDMTVKDHPWQDDTSTGKKNTKKRVIGFFIGPLTFTINTTIPGVQEPLQTKQKPASNSTKQNNVEKGK
jgi:hypothetical protein